jgi:hypothetical protein
MYWVQVKPPQPHLEAWQCDLEDGHLNVFFGVEPDARGRAWWHLSISHRTNTNPPQPGRPVTQDELKEARYRFIPDHVLMCEMFPPARLRVDTRPDAHPTTRHLWEIPLEYAD